MLRARQSAVPKWFFSDVSLLVFKLIENIPNVFSRVKIT